MIVPEDALIGQRGIAIVQQAILKLGFIFREQPIHDVGIDAHVEIVEHGNATGRLLALQIKSGKSYFREEANRCFAFRCHEAHLSYWLHHALPVLLVLCDTEDEVCYWQWLTLENVESTGKQWKVLVPKNQVIESSAARFTGIATRLVPVERFNIIGQKDVSFVLTKRYSLDVLLCGSLSKAEIGSVICNWICRALWIDEKLPESQAPLRWEGEDIGDSIVVEWSNRHDQIKNLYREHSVKKGYFLERVRKMRNKVDSLVAKLKEAIEGEELGGAPADPLFEDLEPEMTAQYFEGSRLGVPPVECRDVDLKFQSVIALAHNLVVPFFGPSPTRSRNRFIEHMQIAEFEKQLAHLDYELEKSR